MKKNFFYIILFAILFGNFSAMPVTAATKQINIKTTVSYKIWKGEKLKLYIRGHRKNKKVKWKSSNKKIASISKKGVVTGKKYGTVRITAILGKKKYKTKVKVTRFPNEIKKYEYDAAPGEPANRFDLINLDDYEIVDE